MVPRQEGAFGQERGPEHSSGLQSGPQVRGSSFGTYWKHKPLVLPPGLENWGGDQPLEPAAAQVFNAHDRAGVKGQFPAWTEAMASRVGG